MYLNGNVCKKYKALKILDFDKSYQNVGGRVQLTNAK